MFLSSRIRNRHYLYGSRTFHQQVRKERKTLISSILWLLFEFLSLKTDIKVNVPSKVKSKKTPGKKLFVGISSATDKKAGLRSDPDPSVSGTDLRIRIQILTKMSQIHNMVLTVKIKRTDFSSMFSENTFAYTWYRLNWTQGLGIQTEDRVPIS